MHARPLAIYYIFGNRTGPNVRIYLDGSETPVIDQNFIELLSNLDWGPQYGGKPAPQNTIAIPHPFAAFTARAGVLHLPIPFAKSCKVTMTEKPFYNIINYRAYPKDTKVRTFTLDDLDSPQLVITADKLTKPRADGGEALVTTEKVPAGGSIAVELPAGPAAVRHLEITLDPAAVAADPTILRSLVLTATFDGEETFWCPVGEFFCSSNRLNTFRTLPLEVSAVDGRMICRWVMPYRESATIELRNLGTNDVAASIAARPGSWEWNHESMRFHANWRADDIIPGTPFLDWNLIEIHGQGVFVGDSWTVLNLPTGWWGEGDEKIYIDDDYDVAKFPSHFGTGTEDYNGWAGGVNPTREDEFSIPWASNAQVGSRESDSTQGYNINMRTRSLDAVPFDSRLVFDMEASAVTSQRNPWDLLMYSVATYWYGKPGTTHNHPPLPAAARRGGPGDHLVRRHAGALRDAPARRSDPHRRRDRRGIPHSRSRLARARRATQHAASRTKPGSGPQWRPPPGDSILRVGMAGVVAADASNRGSFIYQNGGRYSLIEAAEGAVSATTRAQAGQAVALAFVMDQGTARLFVSGVEECHRPFSAGGPTPIDTASLGAVVLGGNLFENGAAPGGGNALGAFHGSIHRFRAFVFDPDGFRAKDLHTTRTPANN